MSGTIRAAGTHVHLSTGISYHKLPKSIDLIIRLVIHSQFLLIRNECWFLLMVRCGEFLSRFNHLPLIIHIKQWVYICHSSLTQTTNFSKICEAISNTYYFNSIPSYTCARFQNTCTLHQTLASNNTPRHTPITHRHLERPAARSSKTARLSMPPPRIRPALPRSKRSSLSGARARASRTTVQQQCSDYASLSDCIRNASAVTFDPISLALSPRAMQRFAAPASSSSSHARALVVEELVAIRSRAEHAPAEKLDSASSRLMCPRRCKHHLRCLCLSRLMFENLASLNLQTTSELHECASYTYTGGITFAFARSPRCSWSYAAV